MTKKKDKSPLDFLNCGFDETVTRFSKEDRKQLADVHKRVADDAKEIERDAKEHFRDIRNGGRNFKRPFRP